LLLIRLLVDLLTLAGMAMLLVNLVHQKTQEPEDQHSCKEA